MLRYARRKDVDQIASLYEELDKIHRDNVLGMFKLVTIDDRSKSILSDIDQKSVHYIVAELNGEILGFAKLLIKIIPEDHPVLLSQTILHIEEMGVKEKRDGIGTNLINYAETVAKECGATVITLQVMKFNSEAKNFYMKVGFNSTFEGMSKAME